MPLLAPLPLPSVPLSLPYDDAQLHEIGTRAAVLLTWFIGCQKSDLVINLGTQLCFAYCLIANTLAYTNKDFCTFLLGRLIRKWFNINANIIFYLCSFDEFSVLLFLVRFDPCSKLFCEFLGEKKGSFLSLVLQNENLLCKKLLLNMDFLKSFIMNATLVSCPFPVITFGWICCCTHTL